jgi:hypothetical protein
MGITDETLRHGGRQWELHRQSECDQCELQNRLRNREWARAWLQQFKGNAPSINELKRLLARETDVTLRLDRATEDAILDQAARLFALGRWHLHGADAHRADTQTPGDTGKQGAGAAKAPAARQSASLGAEAKKAPATAKKELTWVEIQLVDTAGKPVPGMTYEIKMADGSLKSGKLDGSGKARHEQIVPGQCEVRFPELDGSEWKPA